MIDLKCPNCSASISLDETREYGFCSYCGTKIQLVQKVRMMHEGTVNVGGIKTEQQQLETARKMIEIGEYSEASRILENIVRYSPDCGEAWLEFVRIKSDTPTHNLLKRNDCGDIYICNKENSVEDLKRYFFEMLKNSYEFRMAHKILGDNAVKYINTLLQTGYRKIEKSYAESEKLISNIENNYSTLIGYRGHDIFESDMTFFEYDNQVLFYYKFVYYDLKSIKDHNVLLQVRTIGDDIYSHTYSSQRNIVNNSSKTPFLSFDIVFMDKDGIYTTQGDFRLVEKIVTERESDEYKKLIDKRQRRHRCLFCGGEISFWGNCKNHCENWYK